MSCSLKHKISVKEIKVAKNYLFSQENEQNSSDTEETDENDKHDWNVENWMENWEEDNEKSGQLQSDDGSWIHECLVSLSPTWDTLLIAYNSEAVLFSSKRNATFHPGRSSSSKFEISKKLYLPEQENEYITSVLVLPIVSTKKTSMGNVDWNCLIVGFSSGYLRLYTENATKLMSQLFHEKAVVEIKCRTVDAGSGGGRRLSNNEEVDEVTVLYKDTLVVLDGFSLFQTLRACRSQVALAAASGSQTIEPPPMSYKKWTLTGGQSSITSHASVGTLHPGSFDQLRNASVIGGYNTDISNAPRSMSCYAVTGSNPFIGYYYAVEGSSQPLLSHVALAVASKLKSALVNAASGWLSWGRGQQPAATNQQKPKVELGTPLDIRCGIPDAPRHGRKLVIAPGANVNTFALAAMSDSFGRVMLIDITQNVAVRVWKGYRDAQIGFVRVFDDSHNRKMKNAESSDNIHRHALFLIIYAPRRGLLEVWACIHGPRVGAFNVSKNARLLHAGHGLLGTSGMTKQVLRARTFQCCLLEESGKILDIIIPYHLALSDGNSKRARDMHLLKKLNLVLQGKNHGKGIEDEVYNLLLQMRICDTQRQGIEKLLLTRHMAADALSRCITAVMDNLKQAGAVRKDEQTLVKFCQIQLDLIKMYNSVCKLNEHATMFTTGQQSVEFDLPILMDLLRMSNSELQEMIDVISVYKNGMTDSKVRFSETVKPALSIAEFLSCFKINEHNLSSDGNAAVDLKMENTQKIKHLGFFIFQSSLFGCVPPQDILFTLKDGFNLKPIDLMCVALSHWIENSEFILADFTKTSTQLYTYIEEISKDMKLENSLFVLDEDSGSEDHSLKLWNWIRENICYKTTNDLAAYTLAIICRGICFKMKSEEKKTEDLSEEGDMEQMETSNNPPSYEESCKGQDFEQTHGDWETLWVDIEKWNLVIKQLEDCVFINTALRIGGIKHSPSNDEHSKINPGGNTAISLNDIFTKGLAIVAESISKCICNLNIQPELLSHSEFTNLAESWKTDHPKEHTFLSYLHESLQPRLPFSLTQDVLHGHCFWECLLAWNKDHEETSVIVMGVNHLKLVKYDVHAQHGLAVMAWKMTLVKKVIHLAQLIEKVGKAPKDRLCRKEVGVSDTKMAIVCQACSDILQVISDADLDLIPKSDENTPLTDNMEDSWQNIQGQRSIVDMGRGHPRAHYGLVQHFMHLCFILHATMKYNLRSVKPLSRLFDSKGRKCFALDIHVKDPALPNIDFIELSISKYRQEFLEKTVASSVEKLYSLIACNQDKMEYERERNWIETSINIARQFQIDADKIRVLYVSLLYSYGMDQVATEAAIEVTNKETLACSIILIAGQRINYIINHVRPEQGVVMMSQMPTVITLWIKEQDASALKVKEFSIEETLAMSRYVISIMPENNSLYSTSLYLEQAVEAIM